MDCLYLAKTRVKVKIMKEIAYKFSISILNLLEVIIFFKSFWK